MKAHMVLIFMNYFFIPSWILVKIGLCHVVSKYDDEQEGLKWL